MILSKPGGGKTYLLHMLMLEIIENPQISIGKIPIYLKAKEWYRGYENIVEAIRKELEYYSLNIKDEQIIEDLKAGKYILLIDGLDEVINDKDLLIREIHRISQFKRTKIIMTCRQQNYHNEFYKIFTEYNLKALSEAQIQEYIESVFGENVHYGYINKLKKQLKDLIENPLFLYMTAHIMKEITNKVIPKNKSELYEMFIYYIMQERVLKDGTYQEMAFEFDIKEEILMEFAYLNFREKNNSIKFRDIVTSRIEGQENLNLIKKEILQTGVLLEERDRIEFFHPSIEEYFVALKLSRLNEDEVLNFVEINYLNENYYEVFKFTSGLLRNYEQQNLILDKLETKDIYLYHQCLESRFNFNNNLDKIWSKDYLEEYFAQMLRSYLNIIDNFFGNIKSKFYPWCEEEGLCRNDEVAIVGALNRAKLTLSIEIVRNDIDERTIIVSEEVGFATMETRNEKGNVISVPIISIQSSNNWYFDFKQTDFGLDSAREVALYIIKKQLKEILDKQNLFEYESPASLVPCIEYILKDLPEKYFLIENEDVIEKASFYKHSNEEILRVLLFRDNIFKCVEAKGSYGSLNRNYVAPLIYMLFKLIELKVDFKEYLLPQSDIEPKKNSYWVWEVWSDERVIERLIKFFESFQISYRILVKNCFNSLGKKMPLYSMGPVRYSINLERENKGLGGGGISYSWEPVETMKDATPIVKKGRESKWDIEELDKKKAELDIALKRLERKGVGGYSYSDSVLASYINDDRELRNKVYKKIIKDIDINCNNKLN
nr:NACHT domain-containing protein [Clostridium senegalense]